MKNVIMVTMLALVSLTISSSFGAELDLKKSSLSWLGTKVTGRHDGHIGIKKSSIKLKKGKLSSGEFVIDMDSMTVSNLSGKWKEKLLAHMKSEDFFNIKKHPTAKLVLNKLEGSQAKGKLTIKGIEKNVSFKMVQEGKSYFGNIKFDRTKFDMVYGSGSFFKGLGDKAIDNEVNVTFRIVLK